MGSSPKYIQHCKGSGTRTIASMPVPAQPVNISIEIRADGSLWVHYGRMNGKGHISAINNGQGFELYVFRKPDTDLHAN